MSELKVDTLTGKTTAKTVTVTVGASVTQSLEQGLAKSFWYYDQQETANRNSFNVSSIADSSEGEYAVSLVNPMTNVYGIMAGHVARTAIAKFSGGAGNTMLNTSTFRCYTTDSGASNTPSDAESGGSAHGALA